MYNCQRNTCAGNEKRNQVCKEQNKTENVRNTMQITAMKKDDFYRQMFKLTIPIIIQNLLSAAVNSADVIMLNYVGQSAISAVSLASNFSNVLFMVYYGLGTGATLLCAQYYGKGNLEAIHTVEGITLRFSMAISGIVALIAFFLPQKMMLLFTPDQELITIGASYLRIMGITYLCWGITEVYLCHPAKRRSCDGQYGVEYAGFRIECHSECHIYLRTVRHAEAGSYRCRHCYSSVPTGGTGGMRHCIYPE